MENFLEGAEEEEGANSHGESAPLRTRRDSREWVKVKALVHFITYSKPNNDALIIIINNNALMNGPGYLSRQIKPVIISQILLLFLNQYSVVDFFATCVLLCIKIKKIHVFMKVWKWGVFIHKSMKDSRDLWIKININKSWVQNGIIDSNWILQLRITASNDLIQIPYRDRF